MWLLQLAFPFDHGVLGDSLQIGERQVAMPSEYQSRDLRALGTPLIQDVGSLGGTPRLSSQSARDELLNSVPGRRLSQASIDLRDQVLAGWSTSRSRMTGPAKHQTADTGRGLMDREARPVDADELLDDELLKELAQAFHK